MIVDSSALVALLKNEEDFELYAEALAVATGGVSLSAAGYLETAIVADSNQRAIEANLLDEILETKRVRIVPVSESHARMARTAYQRFGRGGGHPAKLNFGDCFAYALAKERGEPLLFKGDDFIHTDIEPALKRG